MMTSATTTLLATIVLATATVSADFLGVLVEEDDFGLDGVTPLVSLPGYAGERVLNVYALFDDPEDRAVGVVGTSGHPFDVQTCGFDYVNAEILGSDTPPSQAEIDFDPTTNWDSFVTIGLKITHPDDQLLVTPDLPGPNADDAPGGVWGDGHENMAWLVPGMIDGMPTPQALAGPDGRVLLMRVALPPEAELHGSFGVLVKSPDGAAEVGVTIGPLTNPCGCPADVAVPADGVVNIDDLIAVLLAWGERGGPADVDGDGLVEIDDLIAVILAWGACR